MSAQQAIPLIPRRRIAGHAHGILRSARRGVGSDVAGARTYVPGDDVRQIDRRASARLSLALARDEFVVRQRYAEEATNVVLVQDVRPSMRLFPPGLPWLCKPAAVAAAGELLETSALRARSQFRRLPTTDLASAFETLLRARLSPGGFVFLASDFLEPPADDLLTIAARRGWDLVLVVVQDATWERSFPDVAGVSLRLFDPSAGRAAPARFTSRECRSRRAANEHRFRGVLAHAREHGLEPIVLSSHRSDDVYAEFCRWVDTRRTPLRGR